MKRPSSLTLLPALLCYSLYAGAAPRGFERALAEFPGKPTGPIAVDYRLAAPPAVGVPLTITVTARVEPDVGALATEATATAPRSVLVTEPHLETARDGNYVWELTVVPLAAEAGYLSVIVAGASAGVAQASSVTIPLGSAASAPEVALPATHGEALIELPVEETP